MSQGGAILQVYCMPSNIHRGGEFDGASGSTQSMVSLSQSEALETKTRSITIYRPYSRRFHNIVMRCNCGAPPPLKSSALPFAYGSEDLEDLYRSNISSFSSHSYLEGSGQLRDLDTVMGKARYFGKKFDSGREC